jgi:perosamine synthetase
MIPVNRPWIGELEEKLVLEVLRSGRLVQGPMVERFEDAVRDVVGTRHAVAVNNGTSALSAALLAVGVRPGDEVITSPFTFVATLNAILHAGAIPRFADIGEDFNVDPQRVAELVSPRTRAVMPVHLYGRTADMAGITSALGGREIAIVEDAAQALDATSEGRPAGSFGVGCFSFYATKNVTTGEGGVVTTDDDAIAGVIRVLRHQGQRATYDYERPGFNLRMTEMEAALGVAQLSRLGDVTEARRENARALTDGLAGIDGLVLPSDDEHGRHVYHQYTVRVTPEARLGRDDLQARLAERGVASGVYYPRPVFDYACFRADPRIGDPLVPEAVRASREVLSLPVHPGLRDADLALIVAAVRDALGSRSSGGRSPTTADDVAGPSPDVARVAPATTSRTASWR